VSFVIGTQGEQQARTSDPARIFYSFRPADDPDGGGPLFVLFNGGPGVSTGILMAFGTGPVRLDDGIADNPASWTGLGDLLYIDARGTGLSYLRSDAAADEVARATAFDLDNFNTYLDAADFIRALMRFMTAHPQLLGREVVIVGESYGGTRATILLNVLLFYRDYDEDGPRRYRDPALIAEIEAFLTMLDPSVEAWTPEAVATRFGRQVLIQPGLGSRQTEIAGELLDLPGSPIWALAAETGKQFIPCSDQPPWCVAWDNAIAFVEEDALRSRYDLAASNLWLSNSFALTQARLSDVDALAAVLGVAPAGIAGILPEARGDAFRMVSAFEYPPDNGTIGELGALAAYDRYYMPFQVDVNLTFRGATANSIGVGAGDNHYVTLLLHNLIHVDTFITAADRDVAIYAPSIPPLLATFTDQVAEVTQAPGEFTVSFTEDPFPDAPAPGSRTVRFPGYDASHSVAVDQAAGLRDDVEAWLAGG
jgi:hypothetical protein